MNFSYVYKTSDGVRRTGAISAPSRDAAFAELRGQGIRPIKVEAVKGKLWGWWVWGCAAAVALIAVLGIGFSVFGGRQPAGSAGRARGEGKQPSGNAGQIALRANRGGFSRVPVSPLPRQAIMGDRDRVAAAAAGLEGVERILAGFAEPGREAPPLPEALPGEGEWAEALRRPVLAAADEFTESIDLKRMVARIKADMRRYVSAGGTAGEYLGELVKRQRLEASFRERAGEKLEELLKAGDEARAFDHFLKANAQLQAMGIWPLACPERLRVRQMAGEFGE